MDFLHSETYKYDLQARAARQIAALQKFDQQHPDRKKEIVAAFDKAKGEKERDKIWDSPIFKPATRVQGKVKGKDGRLKASDSDDRKRTLRKSIDTWKNSDAWQDMYDPVTAREHGIRYGSKGRRGQM